MSKTSPPPSTGSSGATNPLVIAGVTLVVGVGIGWAIGHTTGASAGKAEAAKLAATTGGNGRSGLNSGAGVGDGAAGGNGSGAGSTAPDQVVAGEPKVFTAEADTLLKKLIADLESGAEMNPMELASRIQQLKGMGEEGLRVMAEFLKTNEDFDLPFGDRGGPGGMRGGTLRMALLGALRGEKSETAKEANLYVMKSSPYISEVGMAAWNLNDSWPDEYSDQVKTQMSALIKGLSTNTELSEDQRRRETFSALMYVSRSGSSELLPALESVMASGDGRSMGMYMGTLNNMSPEAQTEALTRLASNPSTAQRLLEDGRGVARLDMSSTTSQQTATNLYNQMNAEQQEDFLEAYRGRGNRGGGGDGGRRWGRGDDGGSEQSTEQRIASAEGSLNVLNSIKPTTPVQQQLHSEAIENLNRRITTLKNPQPQDN